MDLVPLSIAIVLALLLVYVVVSSLIDFFAKDSRSISISDFIFGDPNEIEAKVRGWDTWSPHDPHLHMAIENMYAHNQLVDGNHNSVGAHVEMPDDYHTLWFRDKRAALHFFRDHFYYLTKEYEVTPYEDKFDEKTLAKFDKLIEGDEPSVTVMSNFLTKLFPESFKYIGTLSHICIAKKGMSYLRSEFRDANGKGDSNGPISKSDFDGFIEFLANYEDTHS